MLLTNSTKPAEIVLSSTSVPLSLSSKASSVLSKISHEEMCHLMEFRLEALRYSFASTPNIGILVTCLYVSVITLGAIGNALVIAAVVQNPAMRSPRNIFIVNLALSDFLLCALSVPFNMKMILILYWDLGEVGCRMVSTAQGINIFASTMSLAAIGLDRYFVIIFPTKRVHQRTVITVIFITVWTLSIVFASPYFFATSVDIIFANNLKLNKALLECSLLDSYKICKEDPQQWAKLPFQQREYTIACFLFQYFLPLVTLAFVYGRIGCRMRNRMKHGPSSQSGCHDRRRTQANRTRRTNILLIALVVIFAASWLPLNIYNILIVFQISQYKLTTFAFCHIVGMMSACANPVLYGVLNDNFRTEFERIFERLKILPFLRYVRKQLCPCRCLGRHFELGGRSSTIRRPNGGSKRRRMVYSDHRSQHLGNDNNNPSAAANNNGGGGGPNANTDKHNKKSTLSIPILTQQQCLLSSPTSMNNNSCSSRAVLTPLTNNSIVPHEEEEEEEEFDTTEQGCIVLNSPSQSPLLSDYYCREDNHQQEQEQQNQQQCTSSNTSTSNENNNSPCSNDGFLIIPDSSSLMTKMVPNKITIRAYHSGPIGNITPEVCNDVLQHHGTTGNYIANAARHPRTDLIPKDEFQNYSIATTKRTEYSLFMDDVML